ncbi:MAG: HDOD domain-containing protein [bacterium]|jgi:putative nucleotidyltransferase with HDIG domain|nr:HDOD domain-containing protein [bacterium]
MSGGRSLLAMIEERIAAGDYRLPARSSVAAELHTLTADPDFEMTRVIGLVTGDAALTGEILRVANSALYTGLSKVATVREAVVRLGSAQVFRLAMQTCEKEQYHACAPVLNRFMEPLWQHAVGVAHGSAWLARKLGYRDLEQTAFVAGLLHDVGKLLLVMVIDDVFSAEQIDGGLTDQLIREILESAHVTCGFELARSWGLPEEYGRIIRDHHRDDLSQGGTLINLVALSDKACRRLGLGIDSEPSLVLAVTDEAATLGAGDIVLAQLLVALEDVQAECADPEGAAR